jgi:formylglycine-generating enzyme required for sulfatase activity
VQLISFVSNIKLALFIRILPEFRQNKRKMSVHKQIPSNLTLSAEAPPISDPFNGPLKRPTPKKQIPGNHIMKTIYILRALVLILTLASMALHAQVPSIINYQGRVAVGSPAVNFDGSGAFKFALVDAVGATAYWTNDGTQLDGTEPNTAVSLTVTKGLYSVLLGANMKPIPASVFANTDVRLRVWFNDGTANDSQLLTPDQRITSVGYAMVASTVPDGAITSEKLGSGLTLGGTTSGTFSGDGSELTNVPAAPTTAPIDAATPRENMVWIKEGSFAMGSPSFEVGRSANEGPQTSVTISRGFWMGIYEVTQAQYLAVIGSNPSGFSSDTSRPVETVSWHDAVTYCAALTTSERAAGRCPATWSYRLPTEAEWEYACRAGTTTRFSFGDDDTLLTNYAWYDSISGGTTHPVGQKAANAWGLFDMHGNVFEWCQDSWDFSANYPGGSTIDPLVTTGSYRVLRGGFWGGLAGFARCADRGYGGPDYAVGGYGFRAVLAPGQP